jgi:hypothetical protein
MGEWNRSTRECKLDSITPELKAAIQAHIESYNLGSILNDYRMCIETASQKKKKGLFGGRSDQSVLVAVILTPVWLVWAVRGDRSGVAALSVRLDELVVEDYTSTPGYKLLPDTGIEVTGDFTGRVGMEGSQRVSMFIGLGDEPAALDFKEALFRAVQDVKR